MTSTGSSLSLLGPNVGTLRFGDEAVYPVFCVDRRAVPGLDAQKLVAAAAVALLVAAGVRAWVAWFPSRRCWSVCLCVEPGWAFPGLPAVA